MALYFSPGRQKQVIKVLILSSTAILIILLLGSRTPQSSEGQFARLLKLPTTIQNDHVDAVSPVDCSIDTNLLNSYGYNSSILYSRWDIAVEQSRSFTNFSDRLDIPTPEFVPVDLSQGNTSRSECMPTIKITAPPPVSVNASHLTFGVSTSLQRLNNSLDTMAHWIGGSQARLFAFVEGDGPLKQTIEQRAHQLDIRLTMMESGNDVLDRYFDLTKILYENRDAVSQWGVVIDDDTFFPSMGNLVKRLATYDASQPMYIGGVTESIGRVGAFGFMAFGGAGVFLSMPLLEEMYQHYDKCEGLRSGGGDKQISQCIYIYTRTKLTWDHGLYQLDFQTDASGFYEAGRGLPLSLHHWKSHDWYMVDVLGLMRVEAVCGDNCPLQRWRISDEWFLVNGFSIVKYSSPMMDEIGMEQTWDPSPAAREEGFGFSLGPLRPKDEEKFSLRMRDAVVDPDGSIRQIYIHDPENDEPPHVMEVVWRLVKAV
ncbi:hypothetical protein N7492_010607 [Penicillium capsulatum]|uniref:Glycosyltransferase family 31 protein n=1 Tax=Penicillium capsulatum TaxID=69766 RepID=A0A9W9HMS2_9EURO|nr:hypothetical protein N7492_010607 [Penicillium capsulatum]KAJ6113106.1 hypothetical protein N7512_008430 [Penicillium capsulatum]